MSMKHTGSLAAAIGVLAASQAAAQGIQDNGYYISGQIGIAFDLESDSTDVLGLGLITGSDDRGEIGFSGALGGLGYAFPNGLRIEGAIGQTNTEVYAFADSVGAATFIDSRATALMVNGYYDFRKGKRFQPYVGLGLGVSRINYEAVDLSIDDGLQTLDDAATVATGQAMLGLGYWVSDSLFLFSEYRFTSTLGSGSWQTDSGITVKDQYDVNRISVGLRYSFGG